MNKRRRAYKKHREQRRVPLGYAWDFYADDVCYRFEPQNEMRRKYNAFKRKCGIPQRLAIRVFVRMDGTKEYQPTIKRGNGIYMEVKFARI